MDKNSRDRFAKAARECATRPDCDIANIMEELEKLEMLLVGAERFKAIYPYLSAMATQIEKKYEDVESGLQPDVT